MGVEKGENMEMGAIVSDSVIWWAKRLGVQFLSLIPKETLASKCKPCNFFGGYLFFPIPSAWKWEFVQVEAFLCNLSVSFCIPWSLFKLVIKPLSEFLLLILLSTTELTFPLSTILGWSIMRVSAHFCFASTKWKVGLDSLKNESFCISAFTEATEQCFFFCWILYFYKSIFHVVGWEGRMIYI